MEFPIQNGDFNHSYVKNYQRVPIAVDTQYIPIKYPHLGRLSCGSQEETIEQLPSELKVGERGSDGDITNKNGEKTWDSNIFKRHHWEIPRCFSDGNGRLCHVSIFFHHKWFVAGLARPRRMATERRWTHTFPNRKGDTH